MEGWKLEFSVAAEDDLAQLDSAGQVIGVEALNASRVFAGVTKSLESKSLRSMA